MAGAGGLESEAPVAWRRGIRTPGAAALWDGVSSGPSLSPEPSGAPHLCLPSCTTRPVRPGPRPSLEAGSLLRGLGPGKPAAARGPRPAPGIPQRVGRTTRSQPTPGSPGCSTWGYQPPHGPSWGKPWGSAPTNPQPCCSRAPGARVSGQGLASSHHGQQRPAGLRSCPGSQPGSLFCPLQALPERELLI